MGQVRVYIACSIDGFIAGPGDDLSWLPGAEAGELPPEDASDRDPAAVSYQAFFAGVGAMLMGRGTYDVVRRMGGWFYGDVPVLVATHRPLDADAPATVRAVSGDIEAMVAEARRVAGERDVYVDGGLVIRQALDAGLIDDMIWTVAPIVLGAGHPLFAGVTRRHRVEILGHHDFGGGMIQLRGRPLR